MLSEAYDDYIPSISTCEYWFRCYKKDNFDTDQPKKFEHEKMEALLNQDPNQTQEELAESLNVNRSNFQTIRMIQKQRNWMLYESLKPRNVERRKTTCELLLQCQRHRRKSFLHHIVASDEKWIYTL